MVDSRHSQNDIPCPCRFLALNLLKRVDLNPLIRCPCRFSVINLLKRVDRNLLKAGNLVLWAINWLKKIYPTSLYTSLPPVSTPILYSPIIPHPTLIHQNHRYMGDMNGNPSWNTLCISTIDRPVTRKLTDTGAKIPVMNGRFVRLAILSSTWCELVVRNAL